MKEPARGIGKACVEVLFESITVAFNPLKNFRETRRQKFCEERDFKKAEAGCKIIVVIALTYFFLKLVHFCRDMDNIRYLS